MLTLIFYLLTMLFQSGNVQNNFTEGTTVYEIQDDQVPGKIYSYRINPKEKPFSNACDEKILTGSILHFGVSH